MKAATQQLTLQEWGLAQEYQEATRDARFTALVERQNGFVFRVVYAVLRNTEDAEDVVQDVFLKLYRLRKWEGMENEKAFLARSAWRIAVERRQKRQYPPLPPELSASQHTPEDKAVTSDWNAMMHRMIDALPEELRQPLALSAIEELNSREVAEIMGISEGTVRTRLMRARQLLKQKMASVVQPRKEQDHHGK